VKKTLFLLLFACVAHAETPRSPYRLTWLFPDNEASAIDVDRGDLSVSEFESDYELVQLLEKRPKKAAKARPGAEAVPGRELRVEQLDAAGKVRTTERFTMQLAEWKKVLGARMVERLEDEFDAHLRMLFPRKAPVHDVSPHAPLDLGAP
jgi:hypothetical protein